MEDCFLRHVALDLYARYSDAVSQVRIMIPNRRSMYFFSRELAQVISRPLWLPQYTSMDDLMQRVSSLRKADTLRLVTELYRVYSRYHNEDFESFYFWGEALLRDFDEMDRYMVPADSVFRNISDLKEIGDDLGYLSERQRDVIGAFWGHFLGSSPMSGQKESVLAVWRTLCAIYSEFRASLRNAGIGYSGMIQREAVSALSSDASLLPKGEAYAVVGYCALSECERQFLKMLQGSCDVSFYWDADTYYVSDRSRDGSPNEAGRFLRGNMRDFPNVPGFPVGSTLSSPKDMRIISAASDALQCRYVRSFLEDVLGRDGVLDRRTAVILADASLLMPVLHSVPPEAGKVNVTMGYPLRDTVPYGLADRLMQLQQRLRRSSGGVSFHHADVEAVLSHPLVRAMDPDACARALADIRGRGRVYVGGETVCVSEELAAVFQGVERWQDVAGYVTSVLSSVSPEDAGHDSDMDAILISRGSSMISEELLKLSNSIAESGVEIDLPTMILLARRVLQSLSIPFSGEPLEGVQVMGLLETRNLDFDNVLILSMSDENMSSSEVSASFIPYEIRRAFSLPVREDHDSLYAYNFYHLIQRARRVDMVYCVNRGESSPAERSRFLYQLEYEYSHPIRHMSLTRDVSLPVPQPSEVAKNPAAMDAVREFLRGGRAFSPSSFNRLVQCPVRFWLHDLEGVRVTEDIDENMDAPTFGTVLHRTMELLYAPLVGIPDPRRDISLIGESRVAECADTAISETILRSSTDSGLPGGAMVAREAVIRYVLRSILPYDAVYAGRIVALEHAVECSFAVDDDPCGAQVRFCGKADRLDLCDGGMLRIIDYKTGSPSNGYPKPDIDNLFSGQFPGELQTMIYAEMVRSMQASGSLPGSDAVPALYFIRNMGSPTFSASLRLGGEKVVSVSPFSRQLRQGVAGVLRGLVDPEEPMRRRPESDSSGTCSHCDFCVICSRTKS